MTSIVSAFWRFILIAMASALVVIAPNTALAGSQKKPLKALFITGGGYHDYTKLAPFLTTNLSQLINVKFDVVFNMDVLKSDKFAKSYDIIVYDVCFDEVDPVLLQNALKVARAGKPSVMIHCAVHAFRKSDRVHEWENYCGMRSKVHDPFQPFVTEKLDAKNPITLRFPTDWKTPGDELYQTIELMEGSRPLLRAKSPRDGREHTVCWIHTYGKGRVFATTLGHDFHTAESPDYLRLLSNGLLWTCGKLDDDGNPKSGYAAGN